MKKVLAWVLALALVLSTFAMSFATYTDEAAQKEANCEGQVAVLSALGVVTGYPDGSFKPGNVVTRAEMAALVIRAMGFSDVQETGYTTAYSDVAKEAWCSGVVKQATDLGLIKGYPDGTFKPNNTVTYFEAITMIVRALGYSEEYLVGKWPQNYVNQGRTIDLYADITVKEENFQQGATRGDCAIMIYNMLEKDLVSYDKDGNATQLDGYDTCLNRLAKTLGGTVQRTNMIVEMDDIVSSDVLDEEMLGAPITAWTFQSKDAEGSKVIAVESVNAECYDVTYDRSKITIGEKEYAADSDFYYFYNGFVNPRFNMDRDGNFKENPYGYKVWANISGKKLDVVSAIEWDATETELWDSEDATVLAEEQIVNGDTFKLDDEDAIDTDWFFLHGASALDKIANDNVVTTYATYEFYIDGMENMSAAQKEALEKIKSIEDEIIALDIPSTAKDLALSGALVRPESDLTYNNVISIIAKKDLMNPSDNWKGLWKSAIATAKASLSLAQYDALVKKAEALRDANQAFVRIDPAKGDWVITKVEVGTKTVTGTCDQINVTKGIATIGGSEYDLAVPAWCVFDAAWDFAGEKGTAYLNYKGDIAYWANATTTYKYGILDDVTLSNIKISTSNLGDIYNQLAYFADKKGVLPFDLTAGIFAADKTTTDYNVTLDTSLKYFWKEKGEKYNCQGTIVELARTQLSKLGYGDFDNFAWVTEWIAPVADVLNNGVLCGYNVEGDELNAIDLQFVELAVNKTANEWYSDIEMKSGKLSTMYGDLVVADDVVVFAKDSNDPINAGWAVYGYDELEDATLTAITPNFWDAQKDEQLAKNFDLIGPTTYILNGDGEIAAIKCDYCLEQPEAGFYYVTDVEKIQLTDYAEKYIITFFGGETATTIVYKGQPKNIDSAIEDEFCWVEFDVDGSIINVEKAEKVNEPTKELEDGQYYIIEIDSVVKSNTAKYNYISDADDKTVKYDVTKAGIFKYAEATPTKSSFANIKTDSEAALIVTNNDGVIDYVVWDFPDLSIIS